jgi:hypothetical protein
MSVTKKQQREFAVGKKGKEFWADPVWKTIHIFATTLRPGTGQSYKTFLWTLTDLLPCEVCRKNLKFKLETVPPDPYLSNNHDAFFYSYLLHDLVNEHLNNEHRTEMGLYEEGYTPKQSPPFDDVKTYYFSSLSQECKECTQTK